MRRTRERGQSLLEVVIALSIISLVVLALAKVGISALRNSRFSQSQSLATSLGQKMLSLMVSEKNTAPEDFWRAVENCVDPLGCYHSLDGQFESFVGEHCYVMKLVNAYSLLPTTTPNYSQAEMAKIMVDVYWDEKGTAEVNECVGKIFSHKIHLETYVTN